MRTAKGVVPVNKLNYLWYDSKIRHKIRRIIARIYDMPNAYRVLDIMDSAGGVDVIEAVNIAGQHIDGYFDVRLKHWLSEEDAKSKDLSTNVFYVVFLDKDHRFYKTDADPQRCY